MRLRVLPLLLSVALAGCRDAGRPVLRTSTPPAAEFILATGDSAYWVRTDTAGVHVRGAPIELATVGGRFVEVYVVDDDRSFQNADLIGQSVYRRDLRTGDSVRVFTDSLVPALAREFAAAHPDQQRLRPGEEGDPNPELRATATLEFTGTHGPFVSYSLHTDIERADSPLWHTSRHGVLDLRTGKPATLADIAGSDALGIVERRQTMLRAVLDSVRARAASLLSRYRFDESSFTITTVGGSPAIAYAIPTAGTGDVDQTLPLPPLTFREPTWWRDVAPSLPEASTDGSQDEWRHARYVVRAKYDSLGQGRVVLVDSASREFTLSTVSSPINRIYWLDRPSLDPASRNALVRAFEEAATYGTEPHIALRTPRSPFLLTSGHK